ASLPSNAFDPFDSVALPLPPLSTITPATLTILIGSPDSVSRDRPLAIDEATPLLDDRARSAFEVEERLIMLNNCMIGHATETRRAWRGKKSTWPTATARRDVASRVSMNHSTTLKKTGVRKIPNRVTPSMPLKTATPSVRRISAPAP